MVAYGSRKFALFRKLDEMRGSEPVPVLIYPSHERENAAMHYVIGWTGWYTGHVASEDGAHPAGMKYRPPTTANYPDDNTGFWAVFWHMLELERLPEDRRHPIASLRSYGKDFWRAGTAPRGPEIVARPPWI